MASFTDIPIRKNGQFAFASWFNALRTAGADLEALQNNKFTVQDNVADQVITSMAIDKTTFVSVIFKYSVALRNDAEGRREVGTLIAHYELETDTWEIDNSVEATQGVASGLSFNITTLGQVRVSSGSMAGVGYTGFLTWSTSFRFNAE